MGDLLVIDNYDSFTYNLVAYCRELGAKTTVVFNDELTIQQITKLNPDKILVSPGPGNPDEAGISMAVISSFYLHKPILGVCLGHQCIGQFFGAQVGHAPRLMHGKTSKITHNNSLLFKSIPNNITVTRYHSLILDEKTMPPDLVVTAYTNDNNEIMAIEHQNYPVYGVQFHPEAVLSEHGHKILNNFLLI